MRNPATASLLLTVAAAIGASSQTSTPQSLTAGAWTVTWTADAGRATHKNGQVVSLWEQPRPEPGCDVLASGTLLSVVGTIVSFETSVGGHCKGSAHGFADQMFQVVDLARSGDSHQREVTLYEFFDKAQVQRALDADPFLRDTRADKDWSCTYSLEDFERSFAFHHTKGDKVAVRIGLTHGCEVARGYLTQLGLLLKPRPEFLAELRQAEKAGTLMNRLRRR